MTHSIRIVFVLLLAGPVLSAPAQAQLSVLDEERFLESVNLPTDGEGLLEFFDRRTRSTVAASTMEKLIEQLGADSPQARRAAGGELLRWGSLALPWLRQASKDPDDQPRHALAKRYLDLLEGDSHRLPLAAMRLLAHRAPPKTSEMLLKFVPFSENEDVRIELRHCLAQVAYPDGEPDPVLLKALEDRLAIVRGTALLALAQSGQNLPRRALLARLDDPVMEVRLKAALVLTRVHDEEGLETLIGLLKELPVEQGSLVEEHLLALADQTAPEIYLDESEGSADKVHDAWLAWWVSRSNELLSNEIRKRIIKPEERNQAAQLIERLNDEAFVVRQDATEKLQKLGSSVAPLLRKAMQSDDPEVIARLRRCLEVIENGGTQPLTRATLRQIALRKPKGMVQLLLDYVPAAEDETIVEAVGTTLVVLTKATRNSAPLLDALEANHPVQRALAGATLARVMGKDVPPKVLALLRDPEPSVRLEVGLALVEHGRREAMLPLMEVLAHVPSDEASKLEEYLFFLSEQGFPLPLSSEQTNTPMDEEDVRKHRRDQWVAWWKANGDEIRLVPERSRIELLLSRRGILLTSSSLGKVFEIDLRGKVRWEITGLRTPYDVEWVSAGRLLIAEYSKKTVTERTRNGKIVWTKSLTTYPIGVQRLRNGNTFIVMRNQMIEVDRSGKEVWTLTRPSSDLRGAKRLRNGEIICLTTRSQCLRLDSKGKQLGAFAAANITHYGNQILPDGGILVAETYTNQVVRYDRSGKVRWRAQVNRPVAVCRLRNGHTLVATQKTPYNVVELGRDGKVVKQTPMAGYIVRIKTR